jgi:phosphate starvation-inducible PhoH-like protein
LTTSSASLQHPTLHIELSPENSDRLINLCGPFNKHLTQIETELEVIIKNRGYQFNLSGKQEKVKKTARLLLDLYSSTATELLTAHTVHLFIQQSKLTTVIDHKTPEILPNAKIQTKRKLIKGRGNNQNIYIRNMHHHDLTFGIGPAGTGKTYLAVACAIEALEQDKVRRLVLVRPAVEAGERLGFLPGDLAQKIDPYMRPMYDAMYEFMGEEKVNKLIEQNIIEVAPLAYMRGRTLNDAFIIMDEAQNTTIEQMKMLLTRIGFGSIAVVTGDITQIDLANHQQSGLKNVMKILKDIKDISFNTFEAKDVVRHKLVQKIVNAYEKHQ